MKKHRSNLSFLDLLFNLLIGFVLLFVISFLIISEDKKVKDVNMKTKAEFIITVTWEDELQDDVDTWLKDPLGGIASFRQKNIITAHLDRDDRGMYADEAITVNGKVIQYIYNQEITTIRGIVEGEWILNLHMYRKTGPTPIEVVVKIDKLNPTVKTVFFEKFIMSTGWEEITVTRFEMGQNGDILSWSKLPRTLISIDDVPNTIHTGMYDDSETVTPTSPTSMGTVGTGGT